MYLVACGKQKRSEAAPAASLYRSDWFQKARAYVEARNCPWYILSAAHGLLHPAQIIEPYELSLSAMTAAERRAWGEKVGAQLDEALGRRPRTVIFLAGRLYRQPLSPWVGGRARVPMRGLGIGQQKAWLAARTFNDGVGE